MFFLPTEILRQHNSGT